MRESVLKKSVFGPFEEIVDIRRKLFCIKNDFPGIAKSLGIPELLVIINNKNGDLLTQKDIEDYNERVKQFAKDIEKGFLLQES